MFKNVKRIVYLTGIYKLGVSIGLPTLHILHQVTNFKEPINLKNTYGKDSYVVITGSTDGIGKELALEFAS